MDRSKEIEERTTRKPFGDRKVPVLGEAGLFHHG